MSDKPFERGGLDQATLRAEVEALRSERKRLRAALERIQATSMDSEWIARGALGEESGDD